MQPRLSFVTLGVSDVSRARAFYEALGFRASASSNESVTFFDAGGLVLALFGRASLAADARLADSAPGFSGIALAHNVAEADDVARVLQEAVSAGATLLKPAERVFWGGTAGYFADPDGHVWEVAHNPGFPLDAQGRVRLPPPEATDAEIVALLKSVRTIAVVGISDKPARPSHYVARFLQEKGYALVLVNPLLAGREILGVTVQADLAHVAEKVDVVDIFRNSQAAGEIVRAAIREKDRLAIHAVWMQLGVINEAAAAEAHAAGLAVVMNRCPKIEYPRLIGR